MKDRLEKLVKLTTHRGREFVVYEDSQKKKKDAGGWYFEFLDVDREEVRIYTPYEHITSMEPYDGDLG